MERVVTRDNHTGQKPVKRQKKTILSDMAQFILEFDQFGRQVPSFNLESQGEIKTCFGGLVSIGVIFVTFLFAMVKLEHLMDRKNPNIAQYLLPIEEGDSFDMTSDQFQMAFAIENFNTDTSVTKTVANDARFVQWYATVQKADSAGLEVYTRYLMHTCTAQEFAKFYEP